MFKKVNWELVEVNNKAIPNKSDNIYLKYTVLWHICM